MSRKGVPVAYFTAYPEPIRLTHAHFFISTYYKINQHDHYRKNDHQQVDG
jgi:hypothetical protein